MKIGRNGWKRCGDDGGVHLLHEESDCQDQGNDAVHEAACGSPLRQWYRSSSYA
ncbi:hypothetical protein QE433_003851 [Agrobacterium tumefaciens]|nr:hypothetical protein [Agrobacterium tumefaciens]